MNETLSKFLAVGFTKKSVKSKSKNHEQLIDVKYITSEITSLCFPCASKKISSYYKVKLTFKNKSYNVIKQNISYKIIVGFVCQIFVQ